MQYKTTRPLTVPGLASRRHEDLTRREYMRGYRVLGGDRGDLHFQGYTLQPENNQTVLDSPVLLSYDDMTPDEVNDIAEEVLAQAFESIGFDAVQLN